MDKSGGYARAAADALLSASTAAAAAAAETASEGDEDEDDGGDGAAEEEPRFSDDGCGGESGSARVMQMMSGCGGSGGDEPFAALGRVRTRVIIRRGRPEWRTLRADEAQSASVSRHSATVLEEMVPLSQVALWNRTSVATSMAHRRDDDDNTPPPRSKSPVGDRGGGGGTSETVQTVSTSKKSE